jgi:UDP-N-acetylglucosamine kinase
LSKKQNAILDGTFADYEKGKSNIKRSIGKNRKVGILYIYQDPVLAWKLTKAREEKEGRCVPRKVFINAFFMAKDNVNKIKEEFGANVKISLIEKDYSKNTEKPHLNIDNIDNYLKINYTKESLLLCLE